MSDWNPPDPSTKVEAEAPAEQAAERRASKWWWVLLIGVPLIAVIALIAVIQSAEDDDGDGPTAATGEPATTSAGGETSVETSAETPTTTIAPTTEPAAQTSIETTAPPSTETPTTDAPSTSAQAPTTSVATPTVPPTTSLPVPTTVLPGLVITDIIVSPGKEDGEPVSGAVPVEPGKVAQFPSWTNRVCLFWTVAGMPEGVPNGILWTHEGEVVQALEDTELPWIGPSNDDANWCVPLLPTGIEAGAHRVEYFVAGISQFAADFVIGG